MGQPHTTAAPHDDDADSEHSQLLGDARPALLGTDALSKAQQRLDERIRTLCLVVMALAVCAAALYYLQQILVRFVLALALKYLLTPLIDLLSHSVPLLPESRCGGRCRLKLPRALAILVALVLAVGGLAVLGIVVASSIGEFATHADSYRARLEELLGKTLNATSSLHSLALGAEGPTATLITRSSGAEWKPALIELAKRLNLTEMFMRCLGTAAHVTENSIYIVLFLAFMLAGSSPPRDDAVEDVHAKADAQIFAYIRGKAAISLLVSSINALLLWAIGLDLWLVFAVLTFWLNFIPNVGMFSSVCLPMPLVLLDPRFGTLAVALAFLGPLLAGMVAKDVLEPLLIGHSTSLQPVAVLLSIMLWGSVWGITGMVLAVPMTAVARIYLAGLNHPLPRYFASVLAGTPTEPPACSEQPSGADTELAAVTPM